MKLLLALFTFAIAANSAYAGKLQKLRNFPLKMSSGLQQESASLNKEAGKIVYYGGPVISAPELYTVFWGTKVNSATKTAMPDFYKAIVNSNYMDILNQYNTAGVPVVASQPHESTNQSFSQGKYVSTITITPSKAVLAKIAANRNALDDADIQAELDAQIKAGKLPKPNGNTLFMMHFPAGLTITNTDGTTVARSCQEFCAFHSGFKSANDPSVNVYYGVMPDLTSISCMGCNGGASPIVGLTVSASHELMEAASDAFPTPGSHPDYPQAWNDVNGEEIGDLCQSNVAQLKTKATRTVKAKTFIVQQIWDNKAGACTTTANYFTH